MKTVCYYHCLLLLLLAYVNRPSDATQEQNNAVTIEKRNHDASLTSLEKRNHDALLTSKPEKRSDDALLTSKEKRSDDALLTSPEKRSDDSSLASLVVEVSTLANHVTSLTAQVTALQNQVTQQQQQLNTLNHVYGEWNNQSIITVAPRRPITYGHVTTNVGNGFNVQTSFFTAPVSGLYEFHATFMENQAENRIVHAAIVVEPGQDIALSISDSRHNFFDNTGIHAIAHVPAGKTVHVMNVDDSTANYYAGQLASVSK